MYVFVFVCHIVHLSFIYSQYSYHNMLLNFTEEAKINFRLLMFALQNCICPIDVNKYIRFLQYV